jgi:hypothetical protein
MHHCHKLLDLIYSNWIGHPDLLRLLWLWNDAEGPVFIVLLINYIKQSPWEVTSYSDSWAIVHLLCDLKKNKITMFMNAPNLSKMLLLTETQNTSTDYLQITKDKDRATAHSFIQISVHNTWCSTKWKTSSQSPWLQHRHAESTESHHNVPRVQERR